MVKPTFLPRTINRKIDSGFKQKKRVINFKVLAQTDPKNLKMPDTNPFSAGEQSDEHEEVSVVQEKVKIVESDEESIATETSTNSAPKGPVVTSNGEIKSDSKEESKLKKILAKKAQERIASEQGLKAKIIKKLDEKFPEPPSPQKVCSPQIRQFAYQKRSLFHITSTQVGIYNILYIYYSSYNSF